MQKSLISIAIAGAVAVGFTGCGGGGQPSKPISVYKPLKEEVTITNTSSYIDNGSLVLSNGTKIYDEEGDIKTSFNLGDNEYYLLAVQGKDIFKVKDINKKTLKEFNASALSWFIDNNNVVIAESLSDNKKLGVYDNVYQFDGSDFKLINKNLNLSNGTYTKNNSTLTKKVSKSGMYYIETWYSKGGYLENQTITNVITGKKIAQTEIKTNNEASIYPMVIGIVEDKVYYTYQSGMLSAEYFIEVLDMKTNQVHTLVGDKLFDSNDLKTKMQILKSGNQVVLKIFNDPKLKLESKLFKHTANVESEYTNEPAKYISLNSLKEVNGVSSDFKIVPLMSNYTNASGHKVNETYVTFSTTALTTKYIANIKTSSLEQLF